MGVRVAAILGRAGLVAGCALTLVGCLTWAPGWEDRLADRPGGQASQLYERAERLLEEAGTEESVRSAIAAYQQILSADPQMIPAMVRQAELHVLLGAAYAQSKAEKRESYLSAIRLCERAMGLDPEFRAAVGGGASIEQASQYLGAEHAGAMFWWITGVSYLFKECQSPPQRVINFRWMQRTQGVLRRLGELEPGFQEGGVPFTWGIFYLALPRAVGGDMQRSGESFEAAIALSPGSLLNRWGRAKYYHVKTGDRAAFAADLRWVLAQDPRSAPSPYRWNVYFQRDARALLAGARLPPG